MYEALARAEAAQAEADAQGNLLMLALLKAMYRNPDAASYAQLGAALDNAAAGAEPAP